MEKIRAIYEGLKARNADNPVIEEFPELPPDAKFRQCVETLTYIFETLEGKLEGLDGRQQRLEEEKAWLLRDSVATKTTKLNNSSSERDSLKVLNQSIKQDNATKIMRSLKHKRESLEQRKHEVEEELRLGNETLQAHNELLFGLRKANDKLERENNLEAVKDKVSTQIDLSTRMKNKARLYLHLDEALGLGFDTAVLADEHLAGVRKEVAKGLELEDQAYENFKLLKERE